jgi:hypothetical protein
VKQESRGARRPFLAYEKVTEEGVVILSRPDPEDQKDVARLTQTHLEQINANAPFREIADFLESILYLHVVPQLVRHPREFSGPGVPGDPYGRSFLERVSMMPERTRSARLRIIERGLRVTVPQLKELKHVIDKSEGGVPHLEAVYEHWRPYGAKQREADFSDGTLRLIGLLWALLEGKSPLLLEEPELSLNAGIVSRLGPLISRMQRRNQRQVILSTHSFDLLSDKGIAPEEMLLLRPTKAGTEVLQAARDPVIKALLEGGANLAEAILPRTAPPDIRQLSLFSLEP